MSQLLCALVSRKARKSFMVMTVPLNRSFTRPAETFYQKNTRMHCPVTKITQRLGAFRYSTVFGAIEEGLISYAGRNLRVYICF